ncbi:type IV secretion system protein [Ochrobactrum soli]|uniref:Type IV secretion system protein n=1 Tax=Ochrobactrum soli TaxID=2448455 RepID=A0A849KXI2_9HYPH|nr:type IV secretion system protein [[Ochrobactrum] soli]NNU63378.1 type IV secretion system protein [[Ochrobactrum] soli]
MGLAADIVTDFIDPIDKFITSGVSNLAGELKGPLIAGAALYLVVFGILILLGYVRAPLQDFVVNALKIAFIVALVTQVGNYNYYVKDLFFTQLPEGINSALGKVPGTSFNAAEISNGAAFDRVVDQILSIGKTMAQEGSWRNIYPIFVSIFYTVVAMLVIMVLLAIVLFAKVALALVLVVGPIFICLLLFRVTQPFFSSWLAAAANFVLLQVLVMATITLLVSIINNYLTSASGQNPGAQIIMAWRMLGLFALSLYLALQLPDIAARISGGGLALGGGIISGAARALTKIPSLARGMNFGRAAGGTISKG